MVWETVITDWDGDSEMDQTSLLAAARGLKRNYGGFTIQNFNSNEPFCLNYHPEYLEKINLAFCSSKQLKELCEPQNQAVDSAKVICGISNSAPAAH